MKTVPPPDDGAAPVFVLLDDCQATSERPGSRLFTDFSHRHRCIDPAGLDEVCALIEADLQNGLHAALLIDYEWGAALHGLPSAPGSLQVLMFRQCQRMSEHQVSEWLERLDQNAQASIGGVADLRSETSTGQYCAAVREVQQLLQNGDCYQVNYTYRLSGSQYGSAVGLYRRLRKTQPVPYGVLAHLGPERSGTSDDTRPSAIPHWLLSCSPELLVQHQNGELRCRPMKGTQARSDDPATDRKRAEWLTQDAKNLAENVMIVDLLRNDLGRIAVTGSVRVPRRFEVETYATVHQMTSSIHANLHADVGLPELLRALFPCGSITGAPKRRSMQHIRELEDAPRGIYCGAIGWLEAAMPGAKLGDLCLSVAIRTLTLGARQQGVRPATLGVGSGIVLDSEAEHELQETRWKTRFLQATDPGLCLFETLRLQRGRLVQAERHIQRLQKSAAALGFAFDPEAVRKRLQDYCAALDGAQIFRVRMDLQHSGAVHIQHAVLEPLPAGPVALVLCRQTLPGTEQALRQHKTTLRKTYDLAIQAAQKLQAFDAVFFNARGEVTEGGRSNLLAKIDGRWFTPSLQSAEGFSAEPSAVLPGVMRQRLLARWPDLQERAISLEEFVNAEQLALCNALRGLRHAYWRRDSAGQILEIDNGG